MTASIFKSLDSETIGILSSLILGEDSAKIDKEINRQLYMRVDKALQLIGGKWNRGRKAHVFTDPLWQQKLQEALGSGSILDEKKLYQLYETSPSYAKYICSTIPFYEQESLLEPSAGSGRLVYAAAQCSAGHITAIEIDGRQQNSLLEAGASLIMIEDFLRLHPLNVGLFDCILMNPPFSNFQDVTHIMHAWEFLEPGGTLKTVCSTSYQHTGKRQIAVKFRAFLGSINASVEPTPDNAFDGTNVNAVLISARKSS